MWNSSTPTNFLNVQVAYHVTKCQEPLPPIYPLLNPTSQKYPKSPASPLPLPNSTNLLKIATFTKVVLLIKPTTNPTANLPYGMFLTRLYRHIMEEYPHLNNGIYDIVDRVMRPLALKQTRRPRSDRGKARHSVSSSSSHQHGTSSHQHDDDDDVETSRASTPSPTTYLNSLNPLNYQNYEMPFASE
ncbi:hypothetical protein Tco_0906513 [Tanacetum coccineum]|uniref:Uncharacterized protein n=1 Tax=Tanacetum coccineum TaxID=301880 RepID=A0ABQ5CJ12_9ASTR